MAMTIPAFGSPDCQFISEILSRIGDKWTVLVVMSLRDGAMRFNALKRGVDGISQQMLARTLKALERDGIVLRTVHASKPPRVEYALTSLGQSLSVPIVELGTWAWQNVDAIRQNRAEFDIQG